MLKSRLDPARLPEKKEGYTISELVKFFNSTTASIHCWLSGMRAGNLKNRSSGGYQVQRIRTDDRFIIKKVKKK